MLVLGRNKIIIIIFNILNNVFKNSKSSDFKVRRKKSSKKIKKNKARKVRRKKYLFKVKKRIVFS